jgi:WD40 repeat protein
MSEADPLKTHEVKAHKHNSPLISCRFDPTGQYVFFGAQDGRVWRWQIESDKKAELAGHDTWTRGMAFHSDGQTLITGGYDGRLIWWPATADKPEPSRTIEAHNGWVRAVAVSPDNSLVASVGNDNFVKLWNMADGALVREMPGHQSHVYNVAFHPDGKQLVSGDLKGNLIHWEVETGVQVRQFTVASLHKYDTTFWADIGGFRGLAFSDDGKLLAGGGITNVSNAFAGVGNPAVTLFDWDAGQEKTLHVSKGALRGVIWGVAIHPQSFTIGLSGGGGGGFILFWKHEDKNEFHQVKLPNTARDMDLASDDLHLCTAHFDGQLRLYKMAAKA